ncbi:4-coumarate--CoA ligase-like 7 isoform X2 [Miscanthus floridulus]|uniref:4-coumarate--CoA ligase-like 7 isoform X2 n=1 Tax=Miscanthus floridulus TaxID=154761 RepID=UPI0034590F0A
MPRPSASDADIDPRSGYCASAKTFHSLRTPEPPLPSPDLPLSFPAYALSFLPSPLPAPTAPSRPALVDAGTGESVPFRTFLSRLRALAAALRSRVGLAPGDVAFVLAPAGVHVPVLYYALMSVGAVVSPANPSLTAAEVARLLALSNPRVAFAVAGTRGKLPPGLRTVLLDSPTFLSFLLHDESEDGTGAELVVVRQSDPAAVLYSSGTTGRAKAVVLTHRNIIASNVTRAPAATETLMLAVPLFHIYGFTFCLRAASPAHTLVLHTARARFDAAAVLAAMGRFGVTRLALAPPALLAIVRAAEEDAAAAAAAPTRVATLKTVNCGGAPVAADLIARFSRMFPGVSVTQGYGLTETTAGFCRAVGEEESARIGSVGRLSWGVQVKIVHPEAGAAMPPDVPGELWVRGPFVMKGYLGEEDSTSEILDSEGWLRTGDLCYIDKDGFVYIVDRLKELIKYKGYQVPPAELESLLQTHPDIVEAAVVAYPDDEAGELPVAFVVGRPGSHLHESHIKEFVASQVVHYKRIHHVFLVDSIPQNAADLLIRENLPVHQELQENRNKWHSLQQASSKSRTPRTENRSNQHSLQNRCRS